MIKNNTNHFWNDFHEYISRINRERVLSLYHAFGDECPTRLRVNMYKGCEFACNFCYVWQRRGLTIFRPDRRFVKWLSIDIKDYLRSKMPKFPVMLSCSADPFQPLEEKHSKSLLAMEMLLNAGFPLIIMTQNPGMLLNNRYSRLLMKGHIIVEVTISSMMAGKGGEGIFRSRAPASIDRIKAMALLSKFPVELRVRLDPLVPRFNQESQGQTNDDIDEIVKNSARVGASMVIAKSMLLVEDIPNKIRDNLKRFYLEHGTLLEGTKSNFVLNSNTQENLIMPVINSCKKYKINFCSCTSNIYCNDSVHCSISHKTIEGI